MRDDLKIPFKKELRVLLWSIACLILASSAGKALEGAALRVGDRLKITFYETMDIPDPTAPKGSDPAAAKQQMFYQRLDLSGEYEVESGGTVSLPILGSVEVSGQSLDEAKRNLLSAMSKVMRRAGSVSVTIVQRPPVYVSGSVRNPGSYPYRPGMIAIQALALAGGVEKEQIQASQARNHLKRALAHRAVLVAARDTDIQVAPPKRLLELAGAGGAASLIAAERRVTELRLQSQLKEIETKAKSLSAIRDEISLLNERLKDFDRQINVSVDWLRKMEGLLARRIVVAERVNAIRREFFEIEGRRNEFKVTLAQAIQRLAQAELDFQQLQLRQRAEAESEINRVDADIAQFEQPSATISISSSDRNCCGAESVHMEILRSHPSGADVIYADDSTPLEPGDVLRVTAVRDQGESAVNAPRNGL